MPTAAKTVERVVPIRRILFTLMPEALANWGLAPAADIAMPELVLKLLPTLPSSLGKPT